MVQEELDDYDSFTSPVANKTPLWKFAEQTPSGSRAQSKTKTARRVLSECLNEDRLSDFPESTDSEESPV